MNSTASPLEDPEAGHLDVRVVDEDVLAVRHGDETVTLLGVEPFDGALAMRTLLLLNDEVIVSTGSRVIPARKPIVDTAGIQLFTPRKHAPPERSRGRLSRPVETDHHDQTLLGAFVVGGVRVVRRLEEVALRDLRSADGRGEAERGCSSRGVR